MCVKIKHQICDLFANKCSRNSGWKLSSNNWELKDQSLSGGGLEPVGPLKISVNKYLIINLWKYCLYHPVLSDRRNTHE